MDRERKREKIDWKKTPENASASSLSEMGLSEVTESVVTKNCIA